MIVFDYQAAESSPARRKTSLADIPNEQDIDQLSTRQLKELLARHFVDYKGCVEKHELVTRVERLWRENQRNQQTAEEINNTGLFRNILTFEVIK